jgi:uncharacterized protein
VLPPAPTGRVNDYAGLLKPAERDRLETRLAERERATGVQMAIAIFPSLEGESLEDVAIRLAQQWRIGREGRDDGVILLVFVGDRQMRIEVGYGLEPVIPDAIAGRIIREVLAPAFREQRWAAGLEAAADAIYTRVGGGEAPAARRPAATQNWMALAALGLILVVMAGLALAAQRSARRLQGRRSYTAGRDGWHVPPMWSGGRRGGSWSGGRGGGFSGGGGSFGGGGASGRW